jgi:ABC-type lipoprotein release transport system permease subunit
MKLLHLAWRNLFRHTRRTLITAFAMSIAVALCMGYLAFADGMFGLMFERMVTVQTAHAQLHNPKYPKTKALFETIPEFEKLEKQLRATEGVTATAARVYGYGLFGVREEATGGQVMGVHPGDEQNIRQLADRVIEGRFLSDEPKGEVVLGFKLAETLKAKVSDEVVVVTQSADGSMGNELFEIVGLLRSGSTLLDRTNAVIHRADAQELFVLDGQVHEIALLAPTKEEIDPVVARVEKLVEGREDLLLRKWGELNPAALQFTGMQDAMYLIVALIILGIAGMGVLNTMLMSVFERTKELGVLIALGLKPRQVLTLIVSETFLLSLIAVALGGLFGAVLDWYLVVYGIPFGSDGFEMMGIIFDPVLYAEINPGPIIVTISCVVIISVLASLWPAARAARLKPVIAMREE